MINELDEYIQCANKKELQFLLYFYNELKKIDIDPISMEMQFEKIALTCKVNDFVNPEKYLLDLVQKINIIDYDFKEKNIRMFPNDYLQVKKILENKLEYIHTNLNNKNKRNLNNNSTETQKLINILKYNYDNAPSGYQMTIVHLFGIEYADALKNQRVKDIALAATGKDSLYVEIGKGIKLAKYVKVLKNDISSLMSNKEYINELIEDFIQDSKISFDENIIKFNKKKQYVLNKIFKDNK